MSIESDSLTDQALALPVELRLELADRLLSSLNPPPDTNVERAWAIEAEARVSRAERGETKHVDGQAVFEHIREKHG